MVRSGLLLALGALLVHQVVGHGNMLEPPMRSSAWRFGFAVPPNYNDQGLTCGTYPIQWGQNGGKCGVCGDDVTIAQPRPNENTGTYGLGVIVREYTVGQVVPIQINFTTTHGGYFEFYLCPITVPGTIETEECFQQYPLPLADGSGYRWPLADMNIPGSYNLEVQLPEGLTCSQCVLRWHYNAGHNWGDCGDGTSAMGCGAQEQTRNCADVSIS